MGVCSVAGVCVAVPLGLGCGADGVRARVGRCTAAVGSCCPLPMRLKETASRGSSTSDRSSKTTPTKSRLRSVSAMSCAQGERKVGPRWGGGQCSGVYSDSDSPRRLLQGAQGCCRSMLLLLQARAGWRRGGAICYQQQQPQQQIPRVRLQRHRVHPMRSTISRPPNAVYYIEKEKKREQSRTTAGAAPSLGVSAHTLYSLF